MPSDNDLIVINRNQVSQESFNEFRKLKPSVQQPSAPAPANTTVTPPSPPSPPAHPTR